MTWTNIILAAGLFFIVGYLHEINETLKRHLEENLKHRLYKLKNEDRQ